MLQVTGMAPKLPKPWATVPFISHRLVLPSVWRHMRSVLPSPSKSPLAVICQAVGMAPKEP
jgi:hypothetical protein